MLIFDCYLLAAILLFCSAALLVKLFLKDWFRKSQSSFVQTLPDTYGTPITSHPAMSDSFSAPAIRDLEWKHFEVICCRYLEWRGIDAERTPKGFRSGADGGIDIRSAYPPIVAQCKSWSAAVGLPYVREFLGAITDRGAGCSAIFFASSGFTPEAVGFCRKHQIEMVTADDIYKAFVKAPIHLQKKCRVQVFTSDCNIPTCPNCDIKMVKRWGREDFWGCSRFPRCRQKLTIPRHKR